MEIITATILANAVTEEIFKRQSLKVPKWKEFFKEKDIILSPQNKGMDTKGMSLTIYEEL
jgi:hypothetical protein